MGIARAVAFSFGLAVLSMPAAAQPLESAVAAVAQLEFHSDFLMNLHHALYGAAWARRPEAGTLRALAGALPAPLDADVSSEERTAWNAAIEYYDRNVASRDLLFDSGLRQVKAALVSGDLSSRGVPADLRSTLERAAPVYRKYFWPAHDRTNRAWIEKTMESVRAIGPDVIPRLTKLYEMPWFTSRVRIDVVWVGNRQGGYTTTGPTHVVISSGDPNTTGWSAAEIVFHEVSHSLIAPIERRLAAALGERVREHGILWHVVQFYVTGEVVRSVLAARGVEYTPYVNRLFDRVWGRYRKPVEENWRPYVEGKVTLEKAIEGTVAALR